MEVEHFVRAVARIALFPMTAESKFPSWPKKRGCLTHNVIRYTMDP